MSQSLYAGLDANQYKVVKGLKFYPIKMDSYDRWLNDKPALGLRLSTLPAAYAVLPWISAIFALEIDGSENGQPLGMLGRIVDLLLLSLRLDAEAANDAIRILVDRETKRQLKAFAVYGTEISTQFATCAERGVLTLSRPIVRTNGQTARTADVDGFGQFPVSDDGRTMCNDLFFVGRMYEVTGLTVTENPIAELTPSDMNAVRKAIAELNCEELPDESENPELVEAHAELANITGPRLDFSIRDLIDSVALASNVRFQSVLEWTVAEFEVRKRSIDRAKRFSVNAIVEGYGAKWKNGNPYPSWYADRAEDIYGGFTPMRDLLGKFGSDEAWLEQQIEIGKQQKQSSRKE